MTELQTITPFPSGMNRDGFGWYVSGLTDGEGCFSLLLDKKKGVRARTQPTPCASFAISLRRDDDRVLKLIQSFFQCGSIIYGRTENNCSLRFRTLVELASVINHFDTYPLIAKKSNDYEIWREGVSLLLSVSERKQIRSRGYSSYKWTIDEFADFVVLKEELQSGRKFKETGK